MSENVFQGTLDSIAESDNEIGGLLITRLRSPQKAGADTGSTAAGTPTRLTAPSSIFTAADVGRYIDILLPVSGTPTGDEGTYIVASQSGTYVVLNKIDGNPAAFGTHEGVRWRYSDLLVESVYNFPTDDPLLQVFVEDETYPCPYTSLDSTIGAQKILGLGPQLYSKLGQVDGGDLTTLSCTDEVFTANDVGRTVWVTSTASGNEGPYLITGFTSTRAVVVTPNLVAAEIDAHFALKTYASDIGYTTALRRELSVVIDASQSFSAMDALRRSMLVAYAQGDELDRIGRNLGVARLRGMADETFRRVLQVLPYLPRCTVYGLELILKALYPDGSATVYEDLINFPNVVYILIASVQGNTTVYQGKTFLAPTGADVTPPTDPDASPPGTALGKARRELATSTDSTHVDSAWNPITVSNVYLSDVTQTLEMDVLPTADSPAWTFVQEADSGPVEADCFSVANSILTQTPDTPPSDDGGRYKIAIKPDVTPGSTIELSIWWRITDDTAVDGRPWGIRIDDDVINCQYGIYWDKTTIELSSAPGDNTIGPLTLAIDITDGWHRFSLKRETIHNKHVVSASIDGVDLFGQIDATTFGAAAANEISFGYFYQVGTVQNWSVDWDRAVLNVRRTRDYWNVFGNDGVFDGTDAHLHSASNPFTIADEGKYIRILTEGDTAGATINIGEWLIGNFVGAGEIQLDNPLISDARGLNLFKYLAEVGVSGSNNFVLLSEAFFTSHDLGRKIQIQDANSGSPTNNNKYTITEVVSPYLVYVNRFATSGSNFTPEQGVTCSFYLFDGTTISKLKAANDVWFEIMDTGVVSGGNTLTLRTALPDANSAVELEYTTVLSAQTLRNEMVINEGIGGSAGNVYYPFYLFDVDRYVRALIDDITAAGVWARYEKDL